MKGRTAGIAFAGVSIVLAILLLSGITSPEVSGAVFAVALVMLGGTSRGFRKK